MRKMISPLAVICYTLSWMFIVSAPIYGYWECQDTNPDASIIENKCVQVPTFTLNKSFNTLRGCLRCEDNMEQNERPYKDGGGVIIGCTQSWVPPLGDNACKDDPRYVLRNFPPLDYWDISRALNLMIPLATTIGAIIAGGFLLYGAFTYTTAQGDAKKITDAMHTITWSAVGLIFVVVAYALVRTILYVTQTNNFGF